MRISRYITLLVIFLFVSPIFFSYIVANDNGFFDNEVTSEKVIDDDQVISPNNMIALHFSWPNLAAKERVAYRSNSYGFEILNTSNPETIEVINKFQLDENLILWKFLVGNYKEHY